MDATEEPAARTRVLNGVAVPGTEFNEARDLHRAYEDIVALALRRHVRREDRVVVGGGWGTTTVVAARMTHLGGAVTSFEPSPKMLDVLQRTVRANRVDEVVTTRHAAVGSVSDSSERSFGPGADDVVPPEDIPPCDVLDMDCEGAELEILRSLEARPRLLTVEAHPHLGCSHDDVETQLDRLGYDVVEREPIESGSDIVNYVAIRESEEG